MEKQLSFSLGYYSPHKGNIQQDTENNIRTQKNELRQTVSWELPDTTKECKLKTLSSEKEKDLLFDNLISVKTVSEMLGIAPKTIHNWVYLRKIPYMKVGQKVMFRPKSLKAWLNRKEIKPWL